MLGRKSTIGPSRGRSNSNATSTRSGRGDRDAGFSQVEEEASEPPRSARSNALVDEEGFSVAPADRHRSPWDEPDDSIPGTILAPSAPGSTANDRFNQPFASPPAESAEELTGPIQSPQPVQPKLNLALATAPIQESEEERLAALEKMQQKLQLQPPQQPSRRQTIARGRRDVRNTMFGGLDDSPSSGSVTPNVITPTTTTNLGNPLEQPPVASPDAANGSRPPQQSRQASVSSVNSSNPFDSPGLGGGFASTFVPETEPGLRATMLETINVIIRDGHVTRLQINGEIHLSLRLSPEIPSAQGPIHIRIGDFEKLEKIAPNPSFLAQVPDKPGEYFLNAEVLASSVSNGKGMLLFRYQVHVPAGQELATLPLQLEPAFRCSDGETRMILNYKRNGSSALKTQSKISNCSIQAAFGPGPAVSNVQAKPMGGVWSPSARQMKWTLGDVTEDGKVIAKFVSEPGQPLSPSSVQASWSAEGALISDIDLGVVHGALETGLDFSEVKKGVATGKYVVEITSPTI